MLAFCVSHLAAAGFGPLATSVRTPESLRNRPIWHVSRLPDGELALGFEGGLALGVPGGRWRVIAAPRGQTVKVVAAGHGKLLVAGLGFCGFVDGTSLVPLAGLTGEYICAETVPEGWLVAGSDGAWWITPSGAAERIARPETVFTGNQSRLCRVGETVVVSLLGQAPRCWKIGRLVDDPSLAGFGDAHIVWADGDLCVTSKGITDRGGRLVPADRGKHRLIREGGIVGIADTGSLAVVASFSGGLAAIDRDSGREAWAWREAGDIYCVARNADGILLGTSKGVYSIANPSAVRFWGLDNVLVFELLADGASAATVVTASGRFHMNDDGAQTLTEAWPRQGDAYVSGADLHLGAATTKLRSRFVTGLAVLPETVAVSLSHELVVLSRTGPSSTTPLDGVVGAVATDGRNFLAATTTRGVHVVAPDGRIVDRLGNGRANLSELGPGRVALLFWDGTILDSDANRLGWIRGGNPRDATLVQGRLAVLVTWPDRDPVIGRLTGDSWQPLEIPGLAEIEAEQIACSGTHLFAAGSRGIVRIRLPLVPSVPPPAAWRWSEPAAGNEITLAGSAVDTVRLSMARGEIPPAPATHFRLRIGDGGWADVPPGDSYPVAVAAGRTRVVTQAERNGLVTEAVFTVVRPWPWWLRAWAWPLHAAVLGGLIFGIARLRTRQLVRRNRELETHVLERTRELHKANAVKEEFLASISHEIRNPLNGVVGICAMLADRKVGSREQMLVRALGGCADQLRSMLDDILDFSQLDRKAPTLANNDFELVSLIEECARVMDPELAECALLLPDQPCWLHGDSGKLRQLACNLISNALKYGVPREAGVEVKTVSAENGRVRARLAVRNTGPTIPAAEIPTLFESFRRGSQTAGVPGSGLGLAVCRRLASAMGGHLTAASEEGVTEFAFEVVLPSAQPPAPPETMLAPVSRALAIEDEEYNRLVLGHVLRLLGYSVDWAENGAAALRLAASRPYDLVLTDWRLGDMEGGELCARLLRIMPEPKPPVIAVTAYANAEKMAEARAVGMAGFVTKPVTREKLERIIRGLSTGGQPRRSLDTATPPPSVERSALASLGDLAPSPLRLAAEVAERWRSITTLAGLADPRTAREAHALRSLLLLAGEEPAAEQLALLEAAADAGDWETVQRLRPFAAEEVLASENRLRA